MDDNDDNNDRDLGDPCQQCFQSTAPAVTLEIVDRKINAVISGTTQTRIVGQKIQLLVRPKPGGTMTQIQWTIPDVVLRNYEPNAHNATEYNLTSTDLQTATIDFHWIDGGKKGVQVSAQVAGVALTASVTFNVLAPTDVSMTSKTGGVYVGHGDNADAIQLYLGSGERGVDGVIELGIQFNFKATAPPNGKGKIAGFQLVTILRSYRDNDGNIFFKNQSSWSLDTTFPYGGEENPIDAGQTVTWHFTNNAREEYPSDSPARILQDDWSYFNVDDHYQTWFMYKHSDEDSIWVPL